MQVKSKIDLWIALIIWGTIFFMAGMAITQNDQPVIGYVIRLAFIALLLWIYYGTYYELRDDYLFCRSGPFSGKILYS